MGMHGEGLGPTFRVHLHSACFENRFSASGSTTTSGVACRLFHACGLFIAYCQRDHRGSRTGFDACPARLQKPVRNGRTAGRSRRLNSSKDRHACCWQKVPVRATMLTVLLKEPKNSVWRRMWARGARCQRNGFGIRWDASNSERNCSGNRRLPANGASKVRGS